ncbi:pleckstrin-like domain-containing family G member 4B, partial [Silurus meridionalis]
QGSEAVEDCVQGALSSLYPPFESTAPPLLSQVFSVLESTYQHDSLRYLLDFFIPAKHLLHRLQQHACSQYLGCLFMHSGWPLCLGEKVVVQLSTLDWRLLRSNDFYLQVVPFSTRCPRLALKCLALGGRNVQEVLVPESQHPLVFTAEWLHCVNKERGCKREGGGGLDTCLVTTSDGVVRIPWDEVVYPKLLHNPTDLDHPSTNASQLDYLSSNTGSPGWCSTSGDPDTWSWDEEDDLPPDSNEADIDSSLRHLRQASDGCGDYVELLEPRGGPDGGTDSKQRYLEMHGICKTKSLPLCRRSKAIRIRRGKAWGYAKTEISGRTGSLRRRDSNNSGKNIGAALKDSVNSRPPPKVIDLVRGKQPFPQCIQDRDEGSGDAVLDDCDLYLDGTFKERRPGVGEERKGAGSTLPWEERHRGRASSSDLSSRIKHINEIDPHTKGNLAADQSDQDQGFHSDCVFDDDKSLAEGETLPHRTAAVSSVSDLSRHWTNGSKAKLKTQTDSSQNNDSSHIDKKKANKNPGNSKGQKGKCNEHRKPEKNLSQPGTDNIAGERQVGKLEERVCPKGKDVKVGGFRAPRRRRKAKGGKGKGKSGGRSNPKTKEDPSTAKGQKKASQEVEPSDSPAKMLPCKDNHSDEGKQPECQTEILIDAKTQSDTALLDHSSKDTVPLPPADQSTAPSLKAPLLLRDLNEDLLQSRKFILTGTVDRLGRGLVITEAHVPEEGLHLIDVVQLLFCYYTITRPAAREKGLTVLMDSRQAFPSDLCFDALRSFKAQVPAGLGCVLILIGEEQESTPHNLNGIEVHTVKGTGVLQQYVDIQQLTKELDGDFEHSHSDWLSFRMSLEQLTERCRSVMSLLEDALISMGTEPLPDFIKSVPLSVEKHKQLMTGVLSDQRLTELQRRGGAWLAGLTNGTSRLAHRSPDCRAALAATSSLYDSVDDSLHRLVRVSNQRSHDLEALSRLATLVDKMEKCEKEIDRVQEQLEEFKDPPLSLSCLSLKQQKFKSFRESAMELHSETLVVLGEVESWSELEWGGQMAVLKQIPSIREKVRGMSHCLSDCWTQLDNTQRLLSTLTEASQWCDVVSSSSPHSPPSSPLSFLPPIPPSRFQDARALALELGGGALLDLWAQTLERYQRTLAHFKTRMLQAERGMPTAQGQEPNVAMAQVPKSSVSSTSSLWELEGEGDGEWCGGGGGEGGMQSWGSLASLFRPQNCSTLKIGEEKKKEVAAGSAGGGKFLQNLLNPSKKSPTEAPLPPKPPRRRHPSFDLQALLAPRRSVAVAPKPAEAPLAVSSRSSPLSWLGRKAVAEPILTAGIATAVPGWRDEKVGGGVGGGGVLIRGVEVSSKEVADHTGLTRQHVLLGRTDRETAGERPGTTAQSKLYLQWCRLVNSERQYVALLKTVEETFIPLLGSTDTPLSLRGKADSIFSNWSSLATFHSQLLLPAIEGALSQTLQQTDCFSKYRDQLLQYSHYIRMKPEPDSLLVSQAADFFKAKLATSSVLSTISFPQCLAAPTQRLQYYCEILEELGGVNPGPDSALTIIRHAQSHGEDLRISDLITGCPIPVAERGELVRQGELCVCPGGRRKKTGIRTVFLYQHYIILTKHKMSSQGCSAYTFKNSIKTGEMGLTQSVGEEGLKFEVWVRQTSRTKYCLTLQASSSEDKEAWTHDIAQLLWTHAIHNTELCLKESLCMGVSSKLLLDLTGAQPSELESGFSHNERVQSSCSDSSSVGSQKEGGSPSIAREPKKDLAQTGHTQ